MSGRPLWSFGLVLALVLGAGCRRTPKDLTQETGLIQPSPILGWEWKPSTHRTNSKGMLGPEVGPKKKGGPLRILLLGDSFMEHALLIESLEKAAREEGLQDIEFLNGGVRGYATDHYLIWYREHGRALKPDIVLTFWFAGNDLSGIVKSRDYNGYRKPYFLLEGKKLRSRDFPLKDPSKRMGEDKFSETVRAEWGGLLGSQRALADKQRGAARTGAVKRLIYKTHYFMYKWFPPYRWLKDRMMNAWVEAHPEKARRQLALGDLWYLRHLGYAFFTEGKDLDAAWRLNDALLQALDDDIRADGGRHMVCLIPHLWQVVAEAGERFTGAAAESGYMVSLSAPDERMASFSKRTGIPVLDLTPPLRKASAKGNPYDQMAPAAHWSELGVSVAADSVMKSLLDRGWVAKKR